MKHTFAAAVLIFFATIKVIADIFGLENLSALSAITNVSPAMKVFTAHKGYETYSSIFELSILYSNGEKTTQQLNPENYANLAGPYNRRNVYGALIAYGPILVKNPKTLPMWKAMATNAFCLKPNVLAELGFHDQHPIKEARIAYVNQVQTENDYPNRLEVPCV